MSKKLIFSAVKDHEVISKVINYLRTEDKISLKLHDPTEDFLDLEKISGLFEDIDLLIVKVRSECSIDLLHLAKLYEIPTLHDIDTVLMCKNKIALDFAIRKVLKDNSDIAKNFLIPKSWTHTLKNKTKFKEWATPKLPIVIKSHYQHDKYNRFNFLVQKIEDVEKFCEKYKFFLFYDVYIQEFIECDGMEYKVYVIGDKIYGIERENPIYIYLRDKPEEIDVERLKRKPFEISDDIRSLTKILSKELNLKIFGFDLIKPINLEKYYIIDLNDFPSFKGIQNVEHTLVAYIKNYLFKN
ncbi:MAG: RimK family alpha-L-glutamate ligase [Candidatus Hodarchaeota archaeon]